MNINIKGLRYDKERGLYRWNLNGRECKLRVNQSAFRPTSKVLSPDKAEATKEADELNRQFERFKLGLVRSEKFTFQWCINEFMASEKWQEFSDKRKEPYLYTFEWLKQIKSTKLKTPFLDVNSQEFGKAQLKDLKEQLLKGRSGKGKGHKTSAKIVLEHLRAVMEYLKTNEVEYGRVLNPFLKFDMSYTGNDRAFATLDDLDLAVQQADQLNLGSVGTALLLSYWTTIRVGYIHKLHWNKYKKNYITIYQEKEDTEVDFYLYDDKGKCLYPELAKRLESEYKNKKGVFICMLNAKNRHGKYLNRFNKYTDRYLKDNVKKVLDSIRDKLSDPKIVFASFRKGALSDAQVNIPTKDIQAFSGHKSTSVLTKNYLAKEHLKEKAKITQFKIAKLRGRK